MSDKPPHEDDMEQLEVNLSRDILQIVKRKWLLILFAFLISWPVVKDVMTFSLPARGNKALLKYNTQNLADNQDLLSEVYALELGRIANSNNIYILREEFANHDKESHEDMHDIKASIEHISERLDKIITK